MFGKNTRSNGKRIFGILLSAMLVLSTVILFSAPKASATPDEWVEETDTDFQDGFDAGWANNVVLKGSGAGAWIELDTIIGWQSINPASNPGERDGFAFAFDSKNNVAVLFGGYNETDTSKKNDTWEYDYATNTWTEIIPDGTAGSPPRRTNCRMAYDSANEVMVLWGGLNETNYLLADSWEYDVNAHTWSDAKPITSPAALGSYAIAYDSLNNVTILISCWEDISDPNSNLTAWAYNASVFPRNWVEMSSEPGLVRLGHDMAFNGAEMIIQGGAYGAMGDQYPDDTVKYDYGTDSWDSYAYSGIRLRPGARKDNAMARYYDGVYDVSGYDGFMYKEDTWNFTGTTDGWDWLDETPLAPNPVPTGRRNHRMVWDSYNKVLILYGGYDASGRFNDTWVLGPGYAASGWYYSKCGFGLTDFYYNSGAPNVNWLNITWNETSPPPGTSLKFQLQGDDTDDPSDGSPGETDYVGPDGTTGTYYETPGEGIWTGLDNLRYIRYKVEFEGTFTATPKFHNITISYNVTGPPYIKSADPADNDMDVPLDKNITVVFSKTMNTALLTWTIDPDPCSGLWVVEWSTTTKINDTVTFKHPSALFDENQKYMVNITYAEDIGGNPLNTSLGEPSQWNFTTIGIEPWITFADPADNTINVPLWYNITVDFSEVMDNATLSWWISPDPLSWTEEWANGNTTLYLNHTVLFDPGEEYTVDIDCQDLKGNSLNRSVGEPNPWKFWTYNPEPYVADRDPEHLDVDVPLDKNIVITFSEPMNTTTVTWLVSTTSYEGPPIDLGWTESWELSDTVLNISHSTLFDENTQYWVNVTYGEDLVGAPLNRTASLPRWYFTTVLMSPWLVSTDPANETAGVALDKNIVVVFSEEMNTSTLVWSINPDPLSWTEEWANGNTTLYLNHTVLFDENQQYDVQVACSDIDGNPLNPGTGAGNPWWFTTGFTPPYIVSTDPYDLETGVALDKNMTIVFSEPMNVSSVTWSINPDPLSWTEEWANGNTTLHLNHTTLFAEFTTYEVTITGGKDLSDIALAPGPVPNPWNFTTIVTPPGNLMVIRDQPNMTLIWDPVPNAIEYHIYESQNRFAWPWALLGATPLTQFTHDGAHDDGATHFYIVRAFNGFSETENSTMGVKAHLEFWPPMTPGQFDFHWLSLPYNSMYHYASDVVIDIEGGLGTPTKIQFVAKWDRDQQRTKFFYYSRGKWWGQDFDINPGDAIAIGGVQMFFTWIINGTDMDYELSFIQYHSDWISIPYTGIYAKASDIVMDIEGGLGGPPANIKEVGKWNASAQKYEIFRWDGMAWTGDDFTIDAGEGIYIRSISDHNWTPMLLTPAVP